MTHQVDFQAIVEELPLVVYVDRLDAASTPVYISPQISRLLGYSQEEWLADPGLFERSVHPEDRERVLAEVATRNASGRSGAHADYRMLARDGSMVWVRDDETVVHDEQGAPVYAQGYLQDVTPRVHDSIRLELLVGILSLSTSGLPPADVVAATAERISAFFGNLAVTYAEPNESGGFSVFYSTSYDDNPLPETTPVPGYLGRLSEGTIVSNDVTGDPWLAGLHEVLPAAGIRSFVDVPLLRQGKLVGVVWFNSPEPRTWTEHEVATLEEAAGQLAVMIENARAQEQREQAGLDLERRDAVLEAASRSAALLLAEPQWQSAAPELLRRLGESAAVSRAYLYENVADGELVKLFEWRPPGELDERGRELFEPFALEDKGLARWAERLGRNELVASPVSQLPEVERPVLEQLGIVSLAVVPITVEGVWWGMIGFDDCHEERCWGAAETDALRLAATLVAAAITRQRAEEVLREHEQKLRAVFETAQDAIFITDDEGRYVDANPAGCELLGIAKRDLLRSRIEDFLVPEDRVEFQPDWERYADDSPSLHEWRCLRADGETRQVEATVRANFLPGLHIAFLRDVTERKLLEAELLSAQKLESLGRLAGGVAHDFNNLLTAISGYTSLLLERANGDEPLRRDLGEIARAADRAADLTKQLLAFGRRQLLQPRPVDLNGIVEDVSSLLRRLLGDVELEVRPVARAATVLADPGQLEQVLVNLVMNARNAMPAGGRVTISTRIAADGAVELEVADTGTGMDEETRSQIFEPFFTTRDEGVGLGLASVYGIVTQSGGTIAVESEVGLGSAFVVRLPGAAAAAERTVRPPESAPPVGSETILLVEDEEVVRALTHRVLERCGYRVLPCANGTEAVELADRHAEPIHLLLTDVVMPGLRGHEVAKLVSASRPEIRVLFMSGYADGSLVGQGVIAPGSLIEKPFAVDALARRVREALEA